VADGSVVVIGPTGAGKSLLVATAADAAARRYVGYDTSQIHLAISEGSRTGLERLKSQLGQAFIGQRHVVEFEEDGLKVEVKNESDPSNVLAVFEVGDSDLQYAFLGRSNPAKPPQRSKTLGRLEQASTLLVCIGVFQNAARDTDHWTEAFCNYVAAGIGSPRVVLVVTGLDRLLAFQGREGKACLLDRSWLASVLSRELSLRPVFRNALSRLATHAERSAADAPQAIATSAIGICRIDDIAPYDHWDRAGPGIMHHPYADLESMAPLVGLSKEQVRHLREHWAPLFTADPFVLAAGHHTTAAVELADVLSWAEARPRIMHEFRRAGG
jgi:hypothetical protein